MLSEVRIGGQYVENVKLQYKGDERAARSLRLTLSLPALLSLTGVAAAYLFAPYAAGLHAAFVCFIAGMVAAAFGSAWCVYALVRRRGATWWTILMLVVNSCLLLAMSWYLWNAYVASRQFFPGG